jgi:hypothetical protein
MPDAFDRHQPGLSSPASDMIPVTPNDSTDLSTPGRSIVCGVSGTLSVITYAGVQRDIPASLVLAGVPIPVRVKRVRATGTDATGIWIFT